MFILTDSMRGLLSELASAGHMEVEMDGERLRVTVDCGSPKNGAPEVRACAASALAAAKPAKPRFGKKPGRRPKPEYKVVDGVRHRLYAFNGLTLTLREWAKKYGVGEKTMASRFRANGTPETVRNRSKSDRTSLKARLGDAE